MRILRGGLFVLLFGISTGSGTGTGTTTATATATATAHEWSIANITTCGLLCLLETVPEANCTLLDTACQCRSQILPELTSTCLLQNCTMHDQFVVAKITASTCNLPHQNRSVFLIVIVAIMFSIAFAFVTLRVASRIWVSRKIWLDDWIAVLSFILCLPPTAFTIYMSTKGFGKHVYDLNDGILSNVLRSFYIGESVYVLALALLKVSILILYLRIFPHNSVRYAAFATIGMIAISTAVIFFLTIFSCHPVAFFWDKDIRGGTCLNIKSLAFANSAMSIIQDLFIVALPLPVLAQLNMGRKKKIAVGFMFTIGSFGCIVSMIRLKSLTSFGTELDPTWDYVNAVIWTTVELAVAMICSSLPAIRNLFMHFFPRTFNTSIRQSENKQSGTTPGNSRREQRRETYISEDGFVELQENVSGPLETPPNPSSFQS